jgi:DHA1 family bicyclomycin/chloramphenicol resistance-like MFS transporter
MLTIAGIMAGAWLSGRLAGKIAPKTQIRHGFLIMLSVSVLNVAMNFIWNAARAWWALIPIAVFAFGWALMVPVVTLLVLGERCCGSRPGTTSILSCWRV